MKNTTNLRVSHRYTRLKDTNFNMFATSIVIAMTDNPAFPNPLVPLATLSGLQSDFEQKMLASNLGGRISTAIKSEARAALTDALRREGIYVQGASLSLSMLLSSGYSAASQNRAQTQLLKPSILKILNEGSGQLTLRVSSVANARSYQVQVQVGNGVWQDAGVFPQARRMVVVNLTPGTMYYIRVRAIGGSTGQSQWSDVNGARSL
jgi:hypothetical protein